MQKPNRGREVRMTYETLKLDQNGAVLTLTVNRPEVLNAQSRLMLEEFDQAMMSAAEDDSVKVVIVAGAGSHFSAGHDVGSPQEREDRQRRPYCAWNAGGVQTRPRSVSRQYLALARSAESLLLPWRVRPA
jgi:enoyl-CoA hydratase/carnithine racemase